MVSIKEAIKDFIDSDGVIEIPDIAFFNMYYGMKELLYRFEKITSSLSFEEEYPDEGERKDIYKQLHALDDFCSALRRQIKFRQAKHELMFQVQHDPRFDDPIATKQPVYDPNESQPVDQDDACCQARQCSTVDRDAAPAASSESLKDLLDMQVVAMGKGRCEDCPQDHYGTPCVKVELVGGYYICLAPTPNTVTE